MKRQKLTFAELVRAAQHGDKVAQKKLRKQHAKLDRWFGKRTRGKR